MNKSDNSTSFEQVFQEFTKSDTIAAKETTQKIYDEIIDIIKQYRHIFDTYSVFIDDKNVINNKNTSELL